MPRFVSQERLTYGKLYHYRAAALLAPSATTTRGLPQWRPKTIVSLFGPICLLPAYHRGRRAEGRMAGVGMVYNPRSEHDDRRPPLLTANLFALTACSKKIERSAPPTFPVTGRVMPIGDRAPVGGCVEFKPNRNEFEFIMPKQR